jgi:exopolysaccharide biosynthesis polyprenyl glycosylphosphotransferase
MLAGELRKQKAIFAIGDAIALLISWLCALRLHDPSDTIQLRFLASGPAIQLLSVGATLALWLGVFRWNDLYRMRNGGAREVVAILLGCSEGTLLSLLAFFLLHVEVARITVAIAWAIGIPLVAVVRTISRFAILRIYANPKIAVPLILLGYNSVGQYLCDQVLDELGPYEPVAFLDDRHCGRQYRGIPVLPLSDQFDELSALYPGAEIAIALPDGTREEIQAITGRCERARMDWWLVPWMLPSLARGLKVEQIGIIPLIGRRGARIEGLNFAIKRIFDASLASLLLIVSAPLLGVAALLTLLDDGLPILFRQRRIGAHGEPFEMLKLRTMRTNNDDSVHRAFTANWIRQGRARDLDTQSTGTKFKLTNDDRITPVGRILRRFSIDELPQLFNVVCGQMSLIGPRPGLPYELELYEDWHRRRLDAPPGITGLWQVSGRNQLSFDEMVRLDVRYLEDWSFVGDLKILARTVPAMLRGTGA